MRHHIDGACESPAHDEEGRDYAERRLLRARDGVDGQLKRTRRRHHRADYGDEPELHVPEVSHYRHKDIGVFVRFGEVAAELVVYGVEAFHILLLVVEDLDDLLTRKHFLNVAVEFCVRALLCGKILRAFTADALDDEEHQKDRQ